MTPHIPFPDNETLIGWRKVLRCLFLIGLTFCTQVNAADFYVDSPRVNVWQESDIEVGGWVWGGLTDPVISVKLETTSWSYLLDYGLERGDVAAYLEQPDAVPSGFHGRLELPSSIGSGQSLSIAGLSPIRRAN